MRHIKALNKRNSLLSVIVQFLSIIVVLAMIVPSMAIAINLPNNESQLSTTGSNNATQGILTIALNSYGSFVVNLNPFSTNNIYAPNIASISLIYSPLMYLMNGISPQPGIANSYNMSSNGTSVTFMLNSSMKYNNGQSVNASDVAFTFNYIINNPSIDTHGLSTIIKSIKVINNNEITFYFNKPQYSNIYILLSQPIIYPGQWSNISNPSSYTLTNPIGSGPFMVDSLTTSQFTLKWNSYYPYKGNHLKEIAIPSYPTTTAEVNALESGNVQWLSGAFDADAPTWATKSPNNFYFSPPSGFLWLFLNNEKWPTNNVSVRQAIAYAIDRQVLSNESLQPAFGGYVLPVLDNYLESSFLSQYPNGSYYSYNLAKATAIMQSAGFVKVNGYWTFPNGTPVSITLSGNGAAGNIVANINTMKQELTSFGIQVNEYLPSGTIFYSNVYNGNYSAGDVYVPSYFNPIGSLNYSFSSYWYQPLGKRASGDYARFVNASFDRNITLAAQQTNIANEKGYITNATLILYKLTPAVPLAFTISQNEFNTTGFSGINKTLFSDVVFTNSYGIMASYAVPLLHVYSTTTTTTPSSGISTLDYAIIAIIIIIVVVAAVVAVYSNKKRKNKA
ncbi:MAG: ABC transporter substrate-binding protein [Thermoplasmata archaeon]